MHITSERLLDDGVVERDLTLGETTGVLWTAGTAPAPLILVGHPGGLRTMYPRIAGRARYYAREHGFHAAAIELPGAGDRPPRPDADEARADLRRALEAREPVDEIVDRLVLPLVDEAVPEARAALDDLLALPEVEGPVGCDGGVLAIGLRLALVDPRVRAAVLFAGSFVPRQVVEESRRLTVPVQLLLQWDDEWNDRQATLDVFDAIGSAEKTLHANLGGHTGVPAYELAQAGDFFVRHLR